MKNAGTDRLVCFCASSDRHRSSDFRHAVRRETSLVHVDVVVCIGRRLVSNKASSRDSR
jgi:hypothetical protein